MYSHNDPKVACVPDSKEKGRNKNQIRKRAYLRLNGRNQFTNRCFGSSGPGERLRGSSWRKMFLDGEVTRRYREEDHRLYLPMGIKVLSPPTEKGWRGGGKIKRWKVPRVSLGTLLRSKKKRYVTERRLVISKVDGEGLYLYKCIRCTIWTFYVYSGLFNVS